MSTKTKPGLDGLVQRKGAPRPAAPMPDAVTKPAEPIAGSPKALTVKLAPDLYKRLRRHAAEVDQTHQQLLVAALVEYLDRQEDKAAESP